MLNAFCPGSIRNNRLPLCVIFDARCVGHRGLRPIALLDGVEALEALHNFMHTRH